MYNHYITEYVIEHYIIRKDEGVLEYEKVTPLFAEGKAPTGFEPKNRCFLYDDYSSMLKPGNVFYEIVFLEVKEGSRRKGIGTQLMEEFFRTCNPTSVVLKAGITNEALYTKLHREGNVTDYIYENVVPFYERFGFTDVNDTIFYFDETVPMLWPKSEADEAKRRSDEFRRKMRLL